MTRGRILLANMYGRLTTGASTPCMDRHVLKLLFFLASYALTHSLLADDADACDAGFELQLVKFCHLVSPMSLGIRNAHDTYW